MIEYNLAMEKSLKKMQSRQGVSIVHFIDTRSKLMLYINELINSIDKQIAKMFKWSSHESLHITLLRGSSIEKAIGYNYLMIEYFQEVIKKLNAIKVEASKIILGNDGVIRLHFRTELHLGFDTEMISNASEGLKYKAIRYPWITLAYAKPEYIETMINSVTEIIIPINEAGISYEIDTLSIVKFYDTEFRQYDKIKTFFLSSFNE